MSCFWPALFSSWILCYGTYRLGFDESYVSAKSSERSTHPKRHVTFALTDKKNLCAQFIHQSLMKMMTINLLFVQIALPILKTKMISLWCNHHHEGTGERKAWICRRTQNSCTVTKKKRTSSLARPIGHTATRCVREFAWEIRRNIFFGKKPDGEALRNVINKLLDERNMRDLHLKY